MSTKVVRNETCLESNITFIHDRKRNAGKWKKFIAYTFSIVEQVRRKTSIYVLEVRLGYKVGWNYLSGNLRHCRFFSFRTFSSSSASSILTRVNVWTQILETLNDFDSENIWLGFGFMVTLSWERWVSFQWGMQGFSN